MKKNYLFLIAASVALAFTACSTKEFDLPEDKNPGVTQEMKHISLSATTENDNNTKVTLVGTAYGWSAGVDKVKVTTTEGLVESGAYSAGHFELTYSGSRDGYAVVPSSFLTAADGSNLTITYPSSYDISSYITDSYLDGGKYDAAGAYLPIPMIATSTEGESMLTFYALGALVRVTVSDVPVGTKKLYITFNQTVTGDFAVTSPTPGKSQVVVADTSTPSTVEFTISDTGITAEQAANSFVLYIPVPTTSGLGIASSATTKATVARNRGYAWAVPAITYTGNKGYFQITDGTYVFAPGNLLAHKDGEGVITYSFEDPLISTRGAMSDDPHLVGEKGDIVGRSIDPLLSDLANNRYQDVFCFDVLRAIVGDLETDPVKGAGYYVADDTKYTWNDTYYDTHDYYNFANNSITIAGQNWQVPTESFWCSFTRLYTWAAGEKKFDVNRTGTLATVGGVSTAQYAKVKILVTGNDTYDGYGYVFSDEKLYIPGTLFFPDGYVDQTDLVGTPNTRPSSYLSAATISYDQFVKMVSNGAVFLGAVGQHIESNPDKSLWNWNWVPGTTDQFYGYYISSTFSYDTSDFVFVTHAEGGLMGRGLNCGHNGGAAFANRPLDRSYSVRLVREVTH